MALLDRRGHRARRRAAPRFRSRCRPGFSGLRHAGDVPPVQPRAPGAGGGLSGRFRRGAHRARGSRSINPAGAARRSASTWTTAPARATSPTRWPSIPQTGENFGHPSLRTQAQLQPGGALDQRFLTSWSTGRRARRAPPQQLTSDLGWIRYPSPNSPIPMIKNEELILLRAEASIGLNDLATGADRPQHRADGVRRTGALLGAVRDQPLAASPSCSTTSATR